MSRFVPFLISDTIYIFPSFESTRSVLREQHSIGLVILQIHGDHLPITFVMVDAIRGESPVIECVEKMVLQTCPTVPVVVLALRDPAIVNRLRMFLKDFLILAEGFARDGF